MSGYGCICWVRVCILRFSFPPDLTARACFLPADAASHSFLTLFNHSNDSGIQIPYPSIALHAVKNVTIQLKEEIANKPTTAIYMQLLIAPDEDEYETATLTVIPASVSELGKATTSQLFSAISECSNLHPDPAPEGEENVSDDDRIVFESSQPIQGYSGVFVGASDGGLPPPMPGSGGWITAENVHDFFDADGNYIGNNSARDNSEPEELGSGAGRVRGRDEVDPGEDKTNGTHGDDLDNKRPRVE